MQDTTIHVRRARSGDQDSVAWLFQRFSPLLLAQARHRLGSLAEEVTPEDVLQDVWAVALPAMAGLRAREGRETPVFLKFLSTTLLYRVNELVRRRIRRRIRRRAGRDEGSGLSQLPAPTRGVLSRVAGDEAVRRLRQAIESLPDPDRQVMVLRGIEQRSNQHAAAILGMTPNAVSLRFNRILAGLRAQLGPSLLDELEPPDGLDPAGEGETQAKALPHPGLAAGGSAVAPPDQAT